MLTTVKIDWQILAEIPELKDYFADDFTGFQQAITAHIPDLEALEPADLEKLSILRALEVTNGCTQWAFRRQDEECLSVEQARECMKHVMGFIKRKEIIWPTGEVIRFSLEIEQFITENRELYLDAFKRNVAGADRQFYAYSTAQFLVYGRQRLERALQLVKQHFEFLFTPYYLAAGRRYIMAYLEALPA